MLALNTWSTYNTMLTKCLVCRFELKKRLCFVWTFEPHFDMWLSFYCHIIVVSSCLVDATNVSPSCIVSPRNMYRFATICYAFISMRASLKIFKISSSIWVLHPRLSNCLIDNKFFLKPFTCHTPWMVWMEPSNIFILITLTLTSKAWSFSRAHFLLR